MARTPCTKVAQSLRPASYSTRCGHQHFLMRVALQGRITGLPFPICIVALLPARPPDTCQRVPEVLHCIPILQQRMMNSTPTLVSHLEMRTTIMNQITPLRSKTGKNSTTTTKLPSRTQNVRATARASQRIFPSCRWDLRHSRGHLPYLPLRGTQLPVSRLPPHASLSPWVGTFPTLPLPHQPLPFTRRLAVADESRATHEAAAVLATQSPTLGPLTAVRRRLRQQPSCRAR